MMRRTPAQTAEMMAMTMVATTRHFLPLIAPPMASPPEMKKNTEDQIPAPTVKRGPERETTTSISQENAMIPQMIWAMPSTVVALTL